MSGNMNSRTNEDSLGVNNNSNNAEDDDEVRSTGIVYQWFCSFEDSDDDNNDEDDLFRTVDQELGLAAADAAFDDHHAPRHHHHNKLPLVLAWGLMLVQLATAVGSFWIGHFVLKQWQRDTCVFHDPPYSFASNGEMVLRENLNHPLKENSTISATVLFITAVWIPLVVVAVAGWFLSSSSTRWASRSHRASSNKSYLVIPLMETVAAASGLLTSIGITEALTRILKTVVSRRRPNFYAMCQFDPSTGQCQYTAKCEAQWSFPSGHSSLSAAGMLFVTFYFAGKIIQSSRQQRQRRQQRNNTTTTSNWRCCCCSPMFWCLAQAVACLTWTLYVGATRIADHWHNPSDVAAGLLLGSIIAVGVYHLYFPSLFLRQQQRHNKNNDDDDKHDLAHAATPAGMPRSVAHVLRAAAQEHHHHHQVSSSSRRTTMVEADDSYHAADEDDDDIDIVVDAIMETTKTTNAQPAVV